ncbi:TraM recognition domain-containing protein [Suttonella ornithocola]|uniref:Type IV secretory pathway, VirD4 components n=1 Tax=Suttonella ornithocola TaxID=279832 RepID=A0A380MWI9_9GAMM|nr:TraM recognition domain-containing protein [Suttonella ornithocola]SUO96658.1 Type IV secretory pathway, VirD4 components [Suttonella ornithocola]
MAKLVASLDPFLEKMTTGAVSQLVAPDYSDPNKDVFSWSQIIQSGGIVYVGLDALSDAEVAATVGNSMFADLTSIAGRLYKHGTDHGLPEYRNTGYTPKICLHADEFNELAGPEFVPMLNKAGGAGIQVTAYTQTLSDIEARIGSKPKAEQMLGNFNSLIMLRVLNETTAKIITEKQTQVNVSHLSTFSSASDNSDITSDVIFSSSTQSRETTKAVDLIRVSDLSQLPKGQAFALLDGGNLYKLRIPWLRFDKNEKIPENIAIVASDMRKRYQTIGDEWSKYHEYLNVPEVVNHGRSDNLYNIMLDDLGTIGREDFNG